MSQLDLIRKSEIQSVRNSRFYELTRRKYTIWDSTLEASFKEACKLSDECRVYVLSQFTKISDVAFQGLVEAQGIKFWQYKTYFKYREAIGIVVALLTNTIRYSAIGCAIINKNITMLRYLLNHGWSYDSTSYTEWTGVFYINPCRSAITVLNHLITDVNPNLIEFFLTDTSSPLTDILACKIVNRNPYLILDETILSLQARLRLISTACTNVVVSGNVERWDVVAQMLTVSSKSYLLEGIINRLWTVSDYDELRKVVSACYRILPDAEWNTVDNIINYTSTKLGTWESFNNYQSTMVDFLRRYRTTVR